MNRILLTTNVTWYINASTGNDTTGDGTALNPYKTIQYAHNVLQNNYDLAGYSVIFDIIGTFSAGLTQCGPLIGQKHPTNLILNFKSGSVINTSDLNIFLAMYGIGYVIQAEAPNGLVIASTHPQGVGIEAASGSTIAVNEGLHISTCPSSSVQTSWGGNVYLNNNIKFSGSGSQCLYASGGVIQLAPGITNTWVAPTNYSNCYAWAYAQGIIGINGQTFSGTVTGCRYKAELLGLIATGTMNVNYLPGSLAGGTSFGGTYW